jgi:hypothetical protein
MTAIRVGPLVLVATLALAATLAAAQVSTPKPTDLGIPEAKLPVIDDNACPGKDKDQDNVLHTKLKRKASIYSSWQDTRILAGRLKIGEEIAVLAGVNIVREPDKALMTQPDPDLGLRPGDVVLGYGLRADGNTDFWGKGVRFAVYYESVVAKGSWCGFGDKTQCTVEIIENGVQEWWVKVKRKNGREGWVLASKQSGDKRWDSVNFRNLCPLD